MTLNGGALLSLVAVTGTRCDPQSRPCACTLKSASLVEKTRDDRTNARDQSNEAAASSRTLPSFLSGLYPSAKALLSPHELIGEARSPPWDLDHNEGCERPSLPCHGVRTALLSSPSIFSLRSRSSCRPCSATHRSSSIATRHPRTLAPCPPSSRRPLRLPRRSRSRGTHPARGRPSHEHARVRSRTRGANRCSHRWTAVQSRAVQRRVTTASWRERPRSCHLPLSVFADHPADHVAGRHAEQRASVKRTRSLSGSRGETGSESALTKPPSTAQALTALNRVAEPTDIDAQARAGQPSPQLSPDARQPTRRPHLRPRVVPRRGHRARQDGRGPVVRGCPAGGHRLGPRAREAAGKEEDEAPGRGQVERARAAG